VLGVMERSPRVLFSYWVDHPAKIVMIVDVDDVS
jgi:hypothetical protein